MIVLEAGPSDPIAWFMETFWPASGILLGAVVIGLILFGSGTTGGGDGGGGGGGC